MLTTWNLKKIANYDYYSSHINLRSGGCIVESVETLGLSDGCIVEAVETLGLSGGCIVESVETLSLYGGCFVEAVEIVSLLKYRAPISLGCSSLVCSFLGCNTLGFSSPSSVSSEGVVRVNPNVVSNVADTTPAVDDTITSLKSTSSVLIGGEIATGGGLLDPTVLCVDFFKLDSLLDFVASLEEPLVDRVSGEVPSSSGVGLFE